MDSPAEQASGDVPCTAAQPPPTREATQEEAGLIIASYLPSTENRVFGMLAIGAGVIVAFIVGAISAAIGGRIDRDMQALCNFFHGPPGKGLANTAAWKT